MIIATLPRDIGKDIIIKKPNFNKKCTCNLWKKVENIRTMPQKVLKTEVNSTKIREAKEMEERCQEIEEKRKI